MRNPPNHPCYPTGEPILLGDVFTTPEHYSPRRHNVVVEIKWIAYLREFWIARAGGRGNVHDTVAEVHRPETMTLLRRAAS